MAKVTRTRNTKETGMSYPTVITIASLFSGEMEKKRLTAGLISDTLSVTN